MAKILVADSNVKILDLIDEILKLNGHNVLLCDNGVKAISLVKENLPDLVLVDSCLPVIDGYRLAQKISKDEKLQNIPVIMLVSSEAEKDKVLEIPSVKKTLCKPFKLADLPEIVEILSS